MRPCAELVFLATFQTNVKKEKKKEKKIFLPTLISSSGLPTLVRLQNTLELTRRTQYSASAAPPGVRSPIFFLVRSGQSNNPTLHARFNEDRFRLQGLYLRVFVHGRYC